MPDTTLPAQLLSPFSGPPARTHHKEAGASPPPSVPNTALLAAPFQ